MDEELLPPKLSWPKWYWQFSLSLSIISVAIASVIFFFPGFATENKKFQLARIIIGTVILFIPVLIPMMSWFWKAGHVLYQRVHYYSLLHQYAQRDADELNQLKKFIFDYIQKDIKARAFEITAARHDRGNLYIVLKKRRSPRLSEGSVLAAIDFNDGVLMGWFEVTEERPSEYYAHGVSNIDRVWLSYVFQQGESYVIPNIVAIYAPSGEKQ